MSPSVSAPSASDRVRPDIADPRVGLQGEQADLGPLPCVSTRWWSQASGASTPPTRPTGRAAPPARAPRHGGAARSHRAPPRSCPSHHSGRTRTGEYAVHGTAVFPVRVVRTSQYHPLFTRPVMRGSGAPHPVAELQRLTDAVMAINRTGTASDAIVAMLDAARSLLGAPQAAVVLAPGIVGPHADGALTISSPIGAEQHATALRSGRPRRRWWTPPASCSGASTSTTSPHCRPSRWSTSSLRSSRTSSNRVAPRRRGCIGSPPRADEEHRHLRDLLDTVPSGILTVNGQRLGRLPERGPRSRRSSH